MSDTVASRSLRTKVLVVIRIGFRDTLFFLGGNPSNSLINHTAPYIKRAAVMVYFGPRLWQGCGMELEAFVFGTQV